jgi:predicted transcriptional regulator
MKKTENKLPDLSRAEYDILSVLWKKGKQSVREVHRIMEQKNRWALTTTRTVMDRMTKKGLLQKQNYHGIFLFKPLITRPVGLAKMVQFIADRVFETDTNTVVSMFSNTMGMSSEEIDELRELLN